MAASKPNELTQVVLDYEQTMKRLVPTVRSPSDWAPLAEFVNVPRFERIGTFLELQDWEQYTIMLTDWATSIDAFETTVRRISELRGLVYFEIEERHYRGGQAGVVNSLTVFEFDPDRNITHLAVYLQQPR